MASVAKTLQETIDLRLKAFELVIAKPKRDYVTEEVVRHVLNFTNQKKLPKELYSLVAKMVCEFAEPVEVDTDPMANVKSVKVGDVTIDVSGGHTYSLDAGLQRVLQDYESQLIAFRRLRW